jgi:hypothetical protein
MRGEEMSKWFAGVFATIAAGVITYWLTEGFGILNNTKIYTKTFDPPVEQGVIYAVIDKDTKPNLYLAYQWGLEKNEGAVRVAKKRGAVLRLQHSNAGSYPLTIRTDGVIVSIRQYDNDVAPNEWRMGTHEKVSW